MKGEREIQTQRAQSIAKIYLLTSGLINVLPNDTDKFDFLAMSNHTPDKIIVVEVKATKYPKASIKRVFSKTRRKFARFPLPAILMYIDYDKERGYFEIFKKNSATNHEILPLESAKLKEKLLEIMR